LVSSESNMNKFEERHGFLNTIYHGTFRPF
jgi:hypothetical protein